MTHVTHSSLQTCVNAIKLTAMHIPTCIHRWRTSAGGLIIISVECPWMAQSTCCAMFLFSSDNFFVVDHEDNHRFTLHLTFVLQVFPLRAGRKIFSEIFCSAIFCSIFIFSNFDSLESVYIIVSDFLFTYFLF
jgi:hypothetical protein